MSNTVNVNFKMDPQLKKKWKLPAKIWDYLCRPHGLFFAKQ